jgi:hypothetical protein
VAARLALPQLACDAFFPDYEAYPPWTPDSKALLYSSDCDRALGFTAICRRRFLPDHEAYPLDGCPLFAVAYVGRKGRGAAPFNAFALRIKGRW